MNRNELAPGPLVLAPGHPHANDAMHRFDVIRGATRLGRAFALLTVCLLGTTVAEALPAFARQMNMQCIACHTSFPELTEFGRQFKLSGYTMSAEATDLPPLAIMLQPSFTHTEAGQPGGAAPGFSHNNNFALSQASLFYAGRLFGPYAADLFGKNGATIANKFGIFSQITYDGGAKAWTWDNLELRFANTGTIRGKNLTYGFYANNNPTMQDLWNTTPAWGFPFSSSHLAPTPVAGALIDGALAQQVAGVGAYAMIANTVYVDVGGYHTLGAHLQKQLGVDPSGEDQIGGVAPYWRVAMTKPAAGGTWEIGAFGLSANTYPGRDRSMGQDRFTDLGFDSEFQKSLGKDDVTAMASWIYEGQSRRASQALGSATNAHDHLGTFKATFDYLHDKTYGFSAQWFAIDGSADPLLYSGSRTGAPTSDGAVFQLTWLPLNKAGGPAFWPRSNIKFMLQYVAYNRFDGSRRDIDGTGRSARDNNTLYLEAWIVF